MELKYEYIFPKTVSKKKSNDETSQMMRGAFDKLLRDCRCFATTSSPVSIYGGISEQLKTDCQTFYNESQLSEIFDTLMTKRYCKRQYGKLNWTETESNYLISILAYYCCASGKEVSLLNEKDWKDVEQVFPTKQAESIRKRWNSLLRVGCSASPWSADEDKLLKKLVGQYGSERQWKKISEQINLTFKNGTFRHSRQCRERWLNYLDPNINKGKWSCKDDLNLMKEFLEKGRKWSAIAKALGNRTENAVKNRFKSLIRRETQANESLCENFEGASESKELLIAKNFIEKSMLENFQEENRMSEQEDFSVDRFDSISSEEDTPTDQKSSDYDSQPSYNHQVGGFPAYLPQYQSRYFEMSESTLPFESHRYEYRESCSNLSTDTNCSQVLDYAIRNNEIWNFKMQNCQNMPFLDDSLVSFRLSLGSIAAQRFKTEIQRPDSNVFYAIVNIGENVVNMLERVSEDNWPNDFEMQFPRKLQFV